MKIWFRHLEDIDEPLTGVEVLGALTLGRQSAYILGALKPRNPSPPQPRIDARRPARMGKKEKIGNYMWIEGWSSLIDQLAAQIILRMPSEHP